jgi:hypothetical protein
MDQSPYCWKARTNRSQNVEQNSARLLRGFRGHDEIELLRLGCMFNVAWSRYNIHSLCNEVTREAIAHQLHFDKVNQYNASGAVFGATT